MGVTFSGFKYGYTDNGHVYKKSNIGKRIGTVAGIAALYPMANFGFRISNMYTNKTGLPIIKNVPEFFKKLSNFVKKGPEFGEMLLASIRGGKKAEKVMKFITKSKATRVVAAGLAVALPVVSSALFGRMLGKGVDKIIDHKSKKRADA